MEEDPKILKVKYLSNHWSDLTQIFNWSSGDQTIINILKWRRPPMEDDLKILKVEYLSNRWSDHPRILNLSLGNQTKKPTNAWKEDDHQEDLNISATTAQISLKFPT